MTAHHGWVSRSLLPKAKVGDVLRWDRHWWRVTAVEDTRVVLEETEPPPTPVPPPPE